MVSPIYMLHEMQTSNTGLQSVQLWAQFLYMLAVQSDNQHTASSSELPNLNPSPHTTPRPLLRTFWGFQSKPSTQACNAVQVV